jgi:hypothetical protein
MIASVIGVGTKRCSGCRKELPLTAFNKNAGRKDGYNYNCKTCWAEYQAQRSILRKYGITQEEFRRLLAAQGGGCGICGRKFGMLRSGKRLRLCVDHDHKTNAVRGVLCTSCNNGLGRFKDDPKLLERAVAYLRREGAL